MASSPVTIIDIARALGISKTSVSSALHGSGRVSAETKKRVLEQAERMGYVSNRAAQRLRGGKHGAIGVHFPPDVGELSFYMEFVFGVAEVAASTDNDLLLLTAVNPRSTQPEIDGLLVVDPVDKSFPASVGTSATIPIVTVGEYRGLYEERVAAWIGADHGRLVGDVLDALQRLGVQRPAIAAITESRAAPLWSADVVAGYEAWCANRGCEPLILRARVTPSDDEIAGVLNSAETAGCDALLWVAQGIAPHALALQARGNGANLRLATMATDPGPTRVVSIDLRARDYGREAAQLLIRAINGDTHEGERVVHEASVVTPAVTAAFASKEPLCE